MTAANSLRYGRALARLERKQRILFDSESVAFAEWASGEFRNCFEFGCSYGRTALALAAEGIRVTGYEMSAELVREARMNAHLFALAIDVQCGNFLEVTPVARYDLVACVANTLFMLTSQEEQLQCLRLGRALLRGVNARFVVQCTARDDGDVQDVPLVEHVEGIWETHSGQVRVPVSYLRRNIGQVEQLIGEAGLTVVERRPYGFGGIDGDQSMYTWVCKEDTQSRPISGRVS